MKDQLKRDTHHRHCPFFRIVVSEGEAPEFSSIPNHNTR